MLKHSRLKNFWRERVVGLIVAQFTQGVSAEKISLTIALGICLGIFPILGATTTLCAIAGVSLKLNQPVIQLTNWLASPVQLSLILPFIRLGSWIVHYRQFDISISQLIQKFHQAPLQFFRDFGVAGLCGIFAWLIIAPVLCAGLYFVLLPSMKKISEATRGVSKHAK